ncbi:MAG: glycosyltransferase [Thiolinea sp.]
MARLCYPRARQLVTVSQQAAQIFREALGLKQICCIYNPVDPETLQQRAAAAPAVVINGDYLIAVARLEPQKRLDRLLEAHARTRLRQTAKLLILGEGQLRPQLTARIQELGLEDQVLMPGNVPNPFPNMQAARFMVLSSDHEGFPMVLIEMLALGRPAVATDCDTGPREIITPEVNGLLTPVDDVAALATAMDRLYKDHSLYQRLCSEARASVAHLHPQHIAASWPGLKHGQRLDYCAYPAGQRPAAPFGLAMHDGAGFFHPD